MVILAYSAIMPGIENYGGVTHTHHTIRAHTSPWRRTKEELEYAVHGACKSIGFVFVQHFPCTCIYKCALIHYDGWILSIIYSTMKHRQTIFINQSEHKTNSHLEMYLTINFKLFGIDLRLTISIGRLLDNLKWTPTITVPTLNQLTNCVEWINTSIEAVQ